MKGLGFQCEMFYEEGEQYQQGEKMSPTALWGIP